MAMKPLAPEKMQEAVDMVTKYGTITWAARAMGIPENTLQSRYAKAKTQNYIPSFKPADITKSARAIISSDKARITVNISDGIILVGSDPHYWPGYISTAHRALVKMAGDMKPKMIIMNGDVIDLPAASKYAPIGWEKRPAIKDEVATVQERLQELIQACPGALRAWPLGNHDARFETRIATELPEYGGVKGVHLHDHFQEWMPCWGVWVGGDLVIKHRWKGGVHAVYRNTLEGGVSFVTGHLHSLKVTPFSDYKGTRYGVDTGTLADPYGPQFLHYTEDNPKNWRSGFAVLTMYKGRLLQPELVLVTEEGKIEFRGQVIEV